MHNKEFTAETVNPSHASKGGTLLAVMLIAYFIAKPFYLFDSGKPQIADFIVVLLFVATYLTRQRLPRGTSLVLIACGLFAWYTLMVNAIWAALSMKFAMLQTPVFYIFNSILVYVILIIHARSGDSALKAILIGVVASVVLQFLLSFGIKSIDHRETLFFNNPNQLGHWALLSTAIFCVVSRATNQGIILNISIFLLLMYLAALSLSKATIISFFLLVAIHFTRNVWYFLLIVILGAFILVMISDLPLFESVISRMQNIGEQSDDSLVGRGYGRIWHYPQYLLFGAGEYGLDRFVEETQELHSTLGTVLFSYGIIGIFFFSLIFFRLFYSADFYTMLYLLPGLVFGFTHQGLRFSLFWLLIAVIAVSRRPAPPRNRRLLPWPDRRAANLPGEALTSPELPPATGPRPARGGTDEREPTGS